MSTHRNPSHDNPPRVFHPATTHRLCIRTVADAVTAVPLVLGQVPTCSVLTFLTHESRLISIVEQHPAAEPDAEQLAHAAIRLHVDGAHIVTVAPIPTAGSAILCADELCHHLEKVGITVAAAVYTSTLVGPSRWTSTRDTTTGTITSTGPVWSHPDYRNE